MITVRKCPVSKWRGSRRAERAGRTCSSKRRSAANAEAACWERCSGCPRTANRAIGLAALAGRWRRRRRSREAARAVSIGRDVASTGLPASFSQPEISARYRVRRWPYAHGSVSDERAGTARVQPALIEAWPASNIGVLRRPRRFPANSAHAQARPGSFASADVGDSEFVDRTKIIAPARDALADRSIGSVPFHLAGLENLPVGRGCGHGHRHESVENARRLRRTLQALVERIHQNWLAGPHRAPDIEALYRFARAGLARNSQRGNCSCARGAFSLSCTGSLSSRAKQAVWGRKCARSHASRTSA